MVRRKNAQLSTKLTPRQQRELTRAVKKTVKQYSSALKQLAKT